MLRYEKDQHYDSHYDSFAEEDYGPQSSQRVCGGGAVGVVAAAAWWLWW